MLDQVRRRGRGGWPTVSALILGLGLGIAGGAAPGCAEAAETPAPRWIAADAALYLELPRPTLLLDTASGPQVLGLLRALPPVARYLEGHSYQTLRTVADLVAEKLGTTSEVALRRLTAGGIALAVEGEPGSPSAFLVVTPDEPGFATRALDAVIALARQDAAAKGKPDPVKSAEYRGVVSYQVGRAVAALVEGSLVVTVSDRAETLKRVIDRARDSIPGKASIADDADWKTRRGRGSLSPDTLAWAFARLDRLRTLAPKRFQVPEKLPPPATFLFGSWLEALRAAPWAEARVSAGDQQLSAQLTLPVPPGGYRPPLAGFIPPRQSGSGAPTLLRPPGTIASLSLWRDLSAVWEARAELFSPEVQQNLAKLDGFAGQFFGGRDFGTGVLGALAPRWRLVVAHQDYDALDPRPDTKLPGFALIVDLDPDDDEFSQRLKVAFQSFIGLANLGAAQKGEPPFELGSELCDGVTIATARYMVPKAEREQERQREQAGAGDDAPRAAVHQRYNFTPSIAQVGNHFILSTSTGLTRALISALKAPAAATDLTLLVEADGPTLARLVQLNRSQLIMRNMLDKGHDQAAAQTEIDQFGRLIQSLGRTRLTVQDGGDERLRFDFSFALANPEPD